MTYKEKLIELLKEVPEIKEDLENDYHPMYNPTKETIPLEERHLRMYCEKNGGELKEITWYNTGSMYSRNSGNITKLDNTKSFDNQSEEVYKAIFNFLKK